MAKLDASIASPQSNIASPQSNFTIFDSKIELPKSNLRVRSAEFRVRKVAGASRSRPLQRRPASCQASHRACEIRSQLPEFLRGRPHKSLNQQRLVAKSSLASCLQPFV
jgi:hypothetical protein